MSIVSNLFKKRYIKKPESWRIVFLDEVKTENIEKTGVNSFTIFYKTIEYLGIVRGETLSSGDILVLGPRNDGHLLAVGKAKCFDDLGGVNCYRAEVYTIGYQVEYEVSDEGKKRIRHLIRKEFEDCSRFKILQAEDAS